MRNASWTGTAAAVLAILLVVGCRKEAERPAAAPAQPAPRRVDARSLVGHWVRTDSPYTIQIQAVRDDGTAEAAYFNPRPIHVARAETREADGTIELVVELRDVNYPGSTYTLRYDPQRDILYGIYFQAVERQTYEVAFLRAPGGR